MQGVTFVFRYVMEIESNIFPKNMCSQARLEVRLLALMTPFPQVFFRNNNQVSNRELQGYKLHTNKNKQPLFFLSPCSPPPGRAAKLKKKKPNIFHTYASLMYPQPCELINTNFIGSEYTLAGLALQTQSWEISCSQGKSLYSLWLTSHPTLQDLCFKGW